MYHVWFGGCRRRRRVRFNFFFFLLSFLYFFCLLLIPLFLRVSNSKNNHITHFYPFSLLLYQKPKQKETPLTSPLPLVPLLPQQPIIIINPLLQRLDNQLLSLPLRRLLSPRPHHQPFPPLFLFFIYITPTTRHLQQHLHNLPPLDQPQPVSKTIVLQWGICVSRTDV